MFTQDHPTSNLRIFISHAWIYSSEYVEIVSWLNQGPFKWEDMSVSQGSVFEIVEHSSLAEAHEAELEIRAVKIRALEQDYNRLDAELDAYRDGVRERGRTLAAIRKERDETRQEITRFRYYTEETALDKFKNSLRDISKGFRFDKQIGHNFPPKLMEFLNARIQKSDLTIVLGDLWSQYRDWMAFEFQRSIELKKPVILVRLPNTSQATYVAGFAAVTVDFERKALIDSIQRFVHEIEGKKPFIRPNRSTSMQ
jgi:antiphage defense system Thoeris ThsB-like protein